MAFKCIVPCTPKQMKEVGMQCHICLVPGDTEARGGSDLRDSTSRISECANGPEICFEKNALRSHCIEVSLNLAFYITGLSLPFPY